MNKVIKGKRYDTETANIIFSTGYGYSGDLYYWREELYKKRTGEFFLFGVGGPGSRYSEKTGDNSWSGGEKIIPFTTKEAMEWAEEVMTADEYEKTFGKIDEENEKTKLTVSLKINEIDTLKAEAVKRKITVSELLSKIINHIDEIEI